MTTPDKDQKGSDIPEKVVPKIVGEVDVPFPPSTPNTKPVPSMPIDDKLSQTDDLDKEITRFRFKTGREVLYISIGAMAGMVLLDLVASIAWEAERDMIEGAFEAFKLITMTVLGYIFGSSGSNGSAQSK